MALVSAALSLSFAGAGEAKAATVTYGPTGVEETFTVPDGVIRLHVLTIGAHAGGLGFPQSDGGFGDRVEADIPVTPGQVLWIAVGGGGGGACCGGGGGFNGGGSGFNGGGGPYPAGGGGGASDVRTLRRGFGAASLQSRLIVAGGGGGGGATSSTGQRGGDGGDAGVGGGAGVGSYAGGGGSAGTPTAGGAGGCGAYGGCYPAGSAGFLATGGNSGSYTGSAGGGGGGGGGGGSSGFGETTTNTSVAADRTGASLIAISYKIGGGSASKSGLSFGKVKLNKSKGTAILPVTVPGTGTLSLGGKGVVKQRPLAGPGPLRRLAKQVTQAGIMKLKVKAKGKAKRKLFATGKAKVKAVVTFKPTSGDAVHDSKTVRLKKNKRWPRL